jgi:hypothetical protein
MRAVLSQGDDPSIRHTTAVQFNMLEGSTAAPGKSHHTSVTKKCRPAMRWQSFHPAIRCPERRAKNNILEGYAVLTEGDETRIGDFATPTEIHQLIYRAKEKSETMRGDR